MLYGFSHIWAFGYIGNIKPERVHNGLPQLWFRLDIPAIGRMGNSKGKYKPIRAWCQASPNATVYLRDAKVDDVVMVQGTLHSGMAQQSKTGRWFNPLSLRVERAWHLAGVTWFLDGCLKKLTLGLEDQDFTFNPMEGVKELLDISHDAIQKQEMKRSLRDETRKAFTGKD